MSEIELLPCPFCGSAAEIHVMNMVVGQVANIRCSSCIASNVIFCEPSYNGDIAKDAADAWNKRVMANGVTDQTRLEAFLKLFPNAKLDKNGLPDFCPQAIDNNTSCIGNSCEECEKKYWNAKIGE